MQDIREYLKENILIFDGAMGTYFASLHEDIHINVELANMEYPDRIREIHKNYISCGAKAIRTNTFAIDIENLSGDRSLQREIIQAGFRLAKESAEEDAYVFADIGPVSGQRAEDIFEEYKKIVDEFLSLGAKHFIFETQSIWMGISEIAAYIKARVEDAFIIASFAVMPDGYTKEGEFIKDLYDKASSDSNIDIFGLNCVSGATHILHLLKKLPISEDISIMPNAGYPHVRNNRTYYNTSGEYFAKQMQEIADRGVRILGGCCGTTPEHISQLAGISIPTVKEAINKMVYKKAKAETEYRNRFYEKLISGKKVIAVELDSPKDYNIKSFMTGAKALKEAGADILTIADCPIARARMDSCLLGAKVRRELDMDILPHMTGRDRNINAIKALLLGIYAEGISNVLTITGDPIPSASRDEVRSVYQFNSIKFASYIRSLNEEVFEEPMRNYAALNVNSKNFKSELMKAKAKEEGGVTAFLTQPVMTAEAISNLRWAREELKAKILGGIIPIVSEKNARYMENEVNGIHISEDMIERYVGLEREEAEELAVEICKDIAYKIKDDIDGYYLITPFHRISLMQRIIKAIQEIEGIEV